MHAHTQFCNRTKCVSSEVQNCPECQDAITCREQLFSKSKGVDLAASLYASNALKKKNNPGARKPIKNAAPQTPQHLKEKPDGTSAQHNAFRTSVDHTSAGFEGVNALDEIDFDNALSLEEQVIEEARSGQLAAAAAVEAALDVSDVVRVNLLSEKGSPRLDERRYGRGDATRDDNMSGQNDDEFEDGGFEEGDEDLDLSFEVGQESVSDISADNDDDQVDRAQARALRNKTKKYTFEISPASDDEDVDDETEKYERELAKDMTVKALNAQETVAQVANQALAALDMLRCAEQAKHAIAKLDATRRSTSLDAARTQRVDVAVSSLEACTHRLDGIKAEVVEAITCLKNGRETLADEERKELIENMIHLQQDLEIESGTAKTRSSVSDLAIEGLELIKSLPQVDGESLLSAIIFSQTPVSKMLVQHTGDFQIQLQNQSQDFVRLDKSGLRNRSRSASPSSARSSVRSFALLPTARTEEREEETEDFGAFDSLGVVDQMLVKQTLDELVPNVDDDDTAEKAVVVTAAEAKTKGGEKVVADDAAAAAEAEKIAAPSKKRSFFGFGKKKDEKMDLGEMKKEKKGMFGGFFAGKSEKEEEEEKAAQQGVLMPVEAADAIEKLADAKNLLTTIGREQSVMQIASACTGVCMV